ncbi:hypothetical protein QE367_001742 [Microbacterium paludicola]|uniref:Uncharacterized protein n=1 Tax=Microbacterium paludicola TaxID=300019 RepID=A0ABU1I318_9MICO|nr:hypothetical protein [Microbacterium paludicola]
MTSWSYDFRRMRIFCPAICLLTLFIASYVSLVASALDARWRGLRRALLTAGAVMLHHCSDVKPAGLPAVPHRARTRASCLQVGVGFDVHLPAA